MAGEQVIQTGDRGETRKYNRENSSSATGGKGATGYSGDRGETSKCIRGSSSSTTVRRGTTSNSKW